MLSQISSTSKHTEQHECYLINAWGAVVWLGAAFCVWEQFEQHRKMLNELSPPSQDT